MSQMTLAKLNPRDVADLNAASERLAIVANALKAAKYANGPALVQLLIEANDPIVRVMNKGAGAIVRALERKGVKVVGDQPEIPETQTAAAGEPELEPGEPER
jgi:hypothetical protein